MSIHNDIELQNQYARHLQAGFPLHPTPFARLAAELCCSEADLLTLTRDWVAQHKLREISAILEGQALGYDSALVAGCVAPRDLERVAVAGAAHGEAIIRAECLGVEPHSRVLHSFILKTGRFEGAVVRCHDSEGVLR